MFYCETDVANDKCFTVVLPINAWNTNTAHMLLSSLLLFVFCASQSLSALLDLLWHLHTIQQSVTDSDGICLREIGFSLIEEAEEMMYGLEMKGEHG